MQWFEKRLFKALLNSKTLDTNLSESKIKQGVFRLLNCIKINTWREDKFERSVANGTETVFVTLRFCVVRKQLKATLKPNAAGVQLPPHYYRNG